MPLLELEARSTDPATRFHGAQTVRDIVSSSAPRAFLRGSSASVDLLRLRLLRISSGHLARIDALRGADARARAQAVPIDECSERARRRRLLFRRPDDQGAAPPVDPQFGEITMSRGVSRDHDRHGPFGRTDDAIL
ncbi:hypothetical protein [Nannocystis exedens]|uniref:hypothetical protein n=1 Tax=Nannocystis exedens TaxID=54 RepID=UPI000BBA01AF|nr:hypothetical protein [Nannocystis exedens]